MCEEGYHTVEYCFPEPTVMAPDGGLVRPAARTEVAKAISR